MSIMGPGILLKRRGWWPLHGGWCKLSIPSDIAVSLSVDQGMRTCFDKKGFVEAQSDDGLLEIFGLKQGWHASFVMVELISAKHIAQAAAIRLEIRGGQWKHAYMQMDGEPWKQRMSSEYSSYVEIMRVPHQSLLIRGD